MRVQNTRRRCVASYSTWLMRVKRLPWRRAMVRLKQMVEKVLAELRENSGLISIAMRIPELF